MIELFGQSLGFAQPWVLSGLLLLPALWWLLRLLPPRPRLVRFPSIRLLLGLTADEQTPARLPWWLMLLRLAIAAMLLLAAAQPTLNPRPALPGSGPLVLLVENDWAAASNWPQRLAKLQALLDRPGNDSRPVLIQTTAAPASGDPIQTTGPISASQARRLVGGLMPQPWPDNIDPALNSLETALAHLKRDGQYRQPTIYWFSDGLARVRPDGKTGGNRAVARRLEKLGRTILIQPDPASRPVMIRPAADQPATAKPGTQTGQRSDPTGLDLERADAGPARHLRVQSFSADEGLLSDQQVLLPKGQTRTAIRLDIPVERRNDIREIRLVGQHHAAARLLLDDRWLRRPVGLVAGGSDNQRAQPLLDQLHYLQQAMAPFADLHQGTVSGLLTSPLSVLILADIGKLADSDAKQLSDWIEQGGVLIRFAGPQLANGGDSLLPVRIRKGDRTLGGALSWTQPARLAPFPDNSPFAGLAIPDEVTISRQILAEPSLDLNEKTWARLADGTPLITAERRGKGYLVLFHTTASPDWSSLALSGLFVEMMHRLVLLGSGVATEQAASDPAASLPPLRIMDGFGELGAPGPMVTPIAMADLDHIRPSPEHPPGLYGRDTLRRSLNLSESLPPLEPAATPPGGIELEPLGVAPQTPLLPWLLLTALLLGLIDWLVSLWLAGSFDRLWRPFARHAASAALILLTGTMLLTGPPALGADSDLDLERAMKITSDTYLGYVLTGDRRVDEISHAGLDGLAQMLRQRTAAEVAGAVAVDITRDDLALFPLLYWPMVESQPPLDSATVHRLNDYLRHGGMILFDTRDKLQGGLEQAGPGVQKLRQLTSALDMPPLEPVGPDHVLTRSFYLLKVFPGRYAGGDLWIETTDAHHNDGVASVLIGSHDWAAAWARGADGRPLLPVSPGGERQRELAYRFGINLVMYALTGNYKADQVHVPFILERLGQ